MRLSGRVIEKWSGMPVAGAVVTVNGITVIADGAGNFAVDTSYSPAAIQVIHVHHEPVTATVMIAGDTQIEITLTPVAGALR